MDVGTRKQVVDRSFDLVHGTCPVCLRRKRLYSGRLETHLAPKDGRRARYCVGGGMRPTSEPSVGGVVGGLGTYDRARQGLREAADVFRGAGSTDTDAAGRSDAAQRRYEQGAGVEYSR